MFDVTIIGSGVTGAAVARELSKYNLKTCVVEKAIDVANGTSKANSGIVHAGEDPIPGTLKAKMNVRGNEMFDKLQEEIDFPFKRNESFVLCFDEKDIEKLEELRQRGLKNGLPDTMEILNREEALKLEPNLSEYVVAALRLPTGGIVSPYEFNIALAESAAMNGVEFKLETEIIDIEKKEDGYILKTNKGDIETKVVVNAAGVFGDKINNMVSEKKYHITARKGEYLLFDKTVGDMVQRTIFQLPTKMGKGVLVTPTADGNLLLGPTSVDVEEKDDFGTTREGLDTVAEKAKLSIKEIPMRQVITSFAGLRAHEENSDFIIEEAEDAKNFINAIGIESPGLTSAPAIGEYIREMIVEKLKPEENKEFNPIRKDIPKFREMTNEERKEMIKENSAYGKIVCRCEVVTEGEIRDAIRRPLGAKTVDGIKRRTRAGMGRCQSGFCSNRIVEILAEELGIKRNEVTKFGGNSKILY
ncbi:NAD(P)/FAD-dependent oxidoreductase [Clostridium botulinum]|uniref:Anaerobic glycerol-3-phosphate dehydrogenase subunit a n=1 Tax=Clostridium botulinum (strain Hall / ATCC 3502 / NCTC 13319 / Type A) TaxID=441771 RepID=A5I0R1_CLOBH|nr:NAD(P)/FAD-dependent oxidoreductase [Clostridium botulinum]EPS46703.1 FAD-dependent oxidoreductase [Clostridium botulinum CFSAN002369]ABS35154.1 FAD-dependent oxidoreductase [Clostridium botulinum A str. ATCC 19397]ABS39198.1 FAD-dependent oxidoreductase [Clostridium botulinum A str. Hall]APQ72774.1 pyridine nucleotide-disulfide oxidoreductase family protein [Clostridium botulinum]AUM87219.1 FAD/NAD(P)-binding oxidoreductase [Clostridium botulinum]